MTTVRKTTACAAAVLFLASLAGASFAEEEPAFALASHQTPGSSFTRSLSARVTLAVAPAADKTAGMSVTLTRTAEKSVRVLEVEADRATKAFVEVRSAVSEREGAGFGRKATIREALDGARFEISTAEGRTTASRVPPAEASGKALPAGAAERMAALATLRENAFLPGGPVAPGFEWTCEGDSLSALLAEAGFEGFKSFKARFRFAGIMPGNPGAARIEILSLHAEGGGEEQGAAMVLDGRGEALFDLALGTLVKFSCSGEAGLKDLVSGNEGHGSFEAGFTTVFKE